MKLKQKLLRIFELIITFGMCDLFKERNTYTVKEFLDKEDKLHGIKYCCGDPSPGSYDERLLTELAIKDHYNNHEEYKIYYELLNKENEDNN